MPAKPLSKEQLEDAKRLRDAFDLARALDYKLTQEQLAHNCGWKTQGTVFQYLSGKIPLNPRALAKFSKALQVPPEAISPTLSKYIIDLENEVTLERSWRENVPASKAQNYFEIGLMNPARSRKSLSRGLLEEREEKAGLQNVRMMNIPILAAAGSMGTGESLTYDGDQIIDVLPVSRSWLERNVKAKPQNLRVITGAGDSMHPTFSDGDMLLVDVSKAKIDIDGVYVLSAHERLFIKRVRQRMDGSFEVSSDNPTVKTVDILNGDHQIQVHGRVVWAWNGRAL